MKIIGWERIVGEMIGESRLVDISFFFRELLLWQGYVRISRNNNCGVTLDAQYVEVGGNITSFSHSD